MEIVKTAEFELPKKGNFTKRNKITKWYESWYVLLMEIE